MLGHVTSSYFAARIGRSIALALIENGRARHGETVWASSLGQLTPARIGPPTFFDPQGRRRDG
jgi:sarcosine oxidase subunit alpha